MEGEVLHGKTKKGGERGTTFNRHKGWRKWNHNFHKSRPRKGKRGERLSFKKRLMDMGLTPGTRITVVRSATFHGPLEVSVRGSRLALGRGIAERIFVEIKE